MRNLLDFLARHANWALFIVLEAASLFMLFRFNSYQGSVWLTSANIVAGKAYEVWSAAEAFFGLREENQLLTLRNVYLERKVAHLEEMALSETHDTTVAERIEAEVIGNYKLVTAKVVANSISKADNFITINRGSADGVKTDMAVAGGNGAVGVVYLVSSHYAVVMPLLNVKSRISCAIRGRGYFGYLKWDPADGPDYAYVEDIPRHARFKKGDWVETSGYSSIFPKGVLVGKIEAAYDSSDGLSYRLKVHLSTDFGCLRDVCVINDTTIGERARLMEAARDSIRRTEL